MPHFLTRSKISSTRKNKFSKYALIRFGEVFRGHVLVSRRIWFFYRVLNVMPTTYNFDVWPVFFSKHRFESSLYGIKLNVRYYHISRFQWLGRHLWWKWCLFWFLRTERPMYARTRKCWRKNKIMFILLRWTEITRLRFSTHVRYLNELLKLSYAAIIHIGCVDLWHTHSFY